MRKILFRLLLSFSVCLGAGAAAHAEQRADLRFRLSADPSTLDWNLARSSHETYIIMNLMEGLVEEGPDLKVKPALAENWEISADGKTYTFRLRPGVKWSDGRLLKAQDFEESWFRLLDSKTKSGYASFLYDVDNAQAFHQGKLKSRAAVGIKALSDSVFQIRLHRKVPHFVHLLTFWVTFPVRADLIKKHGASWAQPGKIATLGPYVLDHWKKGSLIRLKKNPHYFGTLSPEVANTVEAVIENDDSRARELFEAKQLDFLLNATTQDLLRARSQGGKGPRVVQFPYLATYYLAFNVQSGPLKDRSIRAAIASTVDRDALPSVLQGGLVPARSWFPPGIEGHSNAGFQFGTLYEARAALTKAGYVEGQRFPTLQFWVERFDGSDLLARFIGKELREKLGLSVEIRFGTPQDYSRDPDAALFLSHWGADYPDAENFLTVFAKASGTNNSRWSSAEYDAQLEKARLTSDAGERLVAFAAAERILVQQEVVILPLFYRKNTALLGSRVREFEISPLNYLFLKSVTVQAPSPR